MGWGVVSVTFDGSHLADADALQRVRAGHPAAFGVLYERHVPGARRLARSLVSSQADADDIVAEVFAATFAAIRRGRGPQTDFVPYLLRSIRRECARTWRRTSPTRQTSLDQVGVDVSSDPDDDYARTDEAGVLRDVFATLPSRMRDVLWQVEVEGLSHDEIARRSRSTPQAVAQLVVRARRALGERYLQAHLGGAATLPAACARTRGALAELVRGTTSPTLRRVVVAHLDTCAGCRAARDHLQLVNERLRGALAVTLATTVLAPRTWIVGLAGRATSWVLGPAVPLTVATSLAVIGVVAPPPMFEPDPPAAMAAAPTDVDPGAGAGGAGPESRLRPDPGRPGTVTAPTAATPGTPTPVTDEPDGWTVPPVADAAPVASVPTVPTAPDAAATAVLPPSEGAVADRPAADVPPAIARPVVDSVTPVVDAVTGVVEPAAAVVEPVTTAVVEPVTAVVDPVVTAIVEPVAPIVEPVTTAVVEPVVAIVDPVVVEPVAAVVDPVVAVVEPVTEIVVDVVPSVGPLTAGG